MPHKRGPKRPHKLTEEALAVLAQAVRQAENSMGWPKNESELPPDLDTARMIAETLRRANENLQAELRRANFG